MTDPSNRPLKRRRRLQNVWRSRRLADYALILLGAAIQAASMHLFFIPAQLVAGGLSGSAQLINSFTGWPIGTIVLVANLPLFVIGWRYLGRRRFLARTVVGAVTYSVVLDALQLLAPTQGLTPDLLLNALYGGVLAGIGAGLVFRASATTGGTDIIARFLDRRFGIPLSRAYLYSDGLVVFLAALAFSWEHALYAVVGLYVGGVVTELTLSGPRLTYVATIITIAPDEVAEQIMADMARGVTAWTAQGMYTGDPRHILLCAVPRAELTQLKLIVHETDPDAFIIIGQSQEVLGEGFRPLTRPLQ
jgi:uncharacterized membrane-anchored protein YitT (DUF2179 family)